MSAYLLPPTLPRPVQFRYIVATSDVLLLSTKVPRCKKCRSFSHAAVPHHQLPYRPPPTQTLDLPPSVRALPSTLRLSTGSSLYCLRTTAYRLPDLTWTLHTTNGAAPIHSQATDRSHWLATKKEMLPRSHAATLYMSPAPPKSARPGLDHTHTTSQGH